MANNVQFADKVLFNQRMIEEARYQTNILV